jgi:hypothetical protein
MFRRAGGSGPREVNQTMKTGAPGLDSETWESKRLTRRAVGGVFFSRRPGDSFDTSNPARCPIQALLGWGRTAPTTSKIRVPHPRRVFVFAPRVGSQNLRIAGGSRGLQASDHRGRVPHPFDVLCRMGGKARTPVSRPSQTAQPLKRRTPCNKGTASAGPQAPRQEGSGFSP